MMGLHSKSALGVGHVAEHFMYESEYILRCSSLYFIIDLLFVQYVILTVWQPLEMIPQKAKKNLTKLGKLSSTVA